MITSCHPSLLATGDTSIAWIAEHLREPWLSPIMIFFSGFGKTGTILFAMAIAYWFWNKHYTKYLGYGMFGSLFLNLLLKGWIQECRPPSQFWMDHLVSNSYSFPSGHAQVGFFIWAGFALYSGSRWSSLLCLFIGTMIAISRPYLGVHYPHDIVAGVLLAVVILTICVIFEKEKLQPLRSLPLWSQAVIVLGLLTLFKLIVNDPIGNSVAGLAGCFGFWFGCQLEARKLQFVPKHSYYATLAQLFVGTGGILLLWKGGDFARCFLPIEISESFKYLQYTLLGLWITYGASTTLTKFYTQFSSAHQPTMVS